MGNNPGGVLYNPVYELTDDNVFGVSVIYLGKWEYFHPDSHEMMPRHILEYLGKYVVIKYYCGVQTKMSTFSTCALF